MIATKNLLVVHAHCAAAARLTACVVMASEYHGTVTTSGRPVPGVTVTAIQADKKVVTTTDERGQFAFAELADGTWMLEVEMLGFSKLTREVGVALGRSPPRFSLKILSEAELLATIEPSRPALAIAPAAPGRPPAGVRPAAPSPQAAFQRVNVNQSASSSAITNEGAIKSGGACRPRIRAPPIRSSCKAA